MLKLLHNKNIFSKIQLYIFPRTKRILLPGPQLLLQWSRSRPSQQEGGLAGRKEHLPRVLHGPRLHGDAGGKQSNLQAHPAE